MNKNIEITMKNTLDVLGLRMPIYNIITRISQDIALYRLKKIVRNYSFLRHENKKGKKVLFNLVRGIYSRPIYIEGGIAKALQYRGYEVKMLVCGKALSMCTCDFTIQRPLNNWNCNVVSKYKKILKVEK